MDWLNKCLGSISFIFIFTNFKDRQLFCFAATHPSANTCRERMLYKVDYQPAQRALGMENLEIPNGWLTESSSYSNTPASYGGQKARLGDSVGWRAGAHDVNQWVQIDFKQNVTIAQISTQGSPQHTAYVMSYSVSYSQDGTDFHFYETDNNIVTFTGNSHPTTIVSNAVSPVITTRFLRIMPKTWSNFIAMRLELYGWYEGSRPLGMENYVIESSQLVASTRLAYEFRAPLSSRLHVDNGWVPNPNQADPWLQVVFAHIVTLVKISCLNRLGHAYYVYTYVVSYGWDKSDLQLYKKNGEVKIFDGNTRLDVIVHQTVSPAIVTRVLRLHPKTGSSRYSMRLEFHGWYGGTSHASYYWECANLCVKFLCERIAYRPSNISSDINCKVGPKNSWLFSMDLDQTWSFYEHKDPTFSCPSDQLCVAPAQCVPSLCGEVGKGYKCVCSSSYSGEHCEIKKLNVYLQGSGTIWKSGKIQVDGVELSVNDGINIVVIDEEQGTILDSQTFDTIDSVSNSNSMAQYLNSLPERRVVLVASQNGGYAKLNAAGRDSLVRIGAVEPFYPHSFSSFAMVGYTGPGTPGFVTQDARNAGVGPAIISKGIRIILGPHRKA